MVIRRLLLGLVWFAVAAAGVAFLWPDLFPDLSLAAVAGEQRLMLGLLMMLVAGALGLAVLMGLAAEREAEAASPY